jgi:hypothetical protein
MIAGYITDSIAIHFAHCDIEEFLNLPRNSFALFSEFHNLPHPEQRLCQGCIWLSMDGCIPKGINVHLLGYYVWRLRKAYEFCCKIRGCFNS